jgi:cysteine-rich repeat protein
VRNLTYEDFVVVGPVQPEGALGAMFGDPAGGPWALVVSDDSGGTIGTLNGWSLTLTTMTGVPPSDAPAVFAANGPLDVPDGDSDGIEVPITVSGLSGPLLDIDAVLDLDSTRASDLDAYLTSPSGRKIELVTDIGGDVDNLWAGTTFDDDAFEPVSDALVPDDGSAFASVVPEGALGAFLGESGNGTWTLTIADDGGGEDSTLQSFSLRLVVPARCGNGVRDAGEECDDGNGGNGDGCDEDCRPSACGNGLVGIDEECDDGNTEDGDGCTSLCMLPELICDDCVDNDGNGRTDLADPSCGGDAAVLKRVKVSKKGALKVSGKAAMPFLPVPGPIRLVVSDASGNTFCATLPDAVLDGAYVTSSAPVGSGTVTVLLPTKAPGKFIVKGTGLDLSMLTDKKTLSVGLVASSRNLFGSKGAKAK